MTPAPAMRKAWAYITRRSELLVFEEPDVPGAGTQVPGGTLDADEEVQAGVLREAREETGIRALSVVRAIGTAQVEWGGTAAVAHAFHMVFSEPVPDRWEHGEFMNAEPIRFAFRWVPIAEAAGLLWPQQAGFLPRLERALAGEVP